MRNTQPPVSSRVANLCFRFQSAWDAGQRPRIEDLLQETPPDQRSDALRALLDLEWVYRRQRHEIIDEEEYCRRFPDFSAGIREWLHATEMPTPTEANEKRGPVSLPGYEIIEELGRGGMGVVFKARDVQLKRLVAVKMILSADLAGTHELVRFQREAEATARLAHEGIVQVFHVGTHQGRPYLIMELVQGGSLASKLRGKPVPARQVATIGAQLARAVEAAHEAAIVHRDLKPGNILVGPNWQLKVGDFGLARRLDEPGQTRTGAVLGTPAYMSPEQAQGKKEIGPATDIWSLGAILYELLTGQPPFRGASMMEILQAVIHRDPVRPAKVNPKAPADLETICLKCLEKEPARRYGSAAALADDLDRFLRHEPIQARSTGVVERLFKSIRRRPAWAALAGMSTVAVLLVCVGWYFARQARNKDATIDQLGQSNEKTQLALNEEGRKKQEAARQKREQERLARYQRTLLHAEILWPAAPLLARKLLDDGETCPNDLREDRFRRLRTLCNRPAGLLPTPDSAPDIVMGNTKGDPVVFSPDGKVLARAAQLPAGRGTPAMGTSNMDLQLVDVETGGVLHSLGTYSHTGSIENHVAFSPDGKLVAVILPPRADEMSPSRPLQPSRINTSSSIQLWDVKTARPVRKFPLPEGTLQRTEERLVFRPDSAALAVLTKTINRDKLFNRPITPATIGQLSLYRSTVTVLDVKSGATLTTLGDEQGQISVMAFSRDGKRLVTAGSRAKADGLKGGWFAFWDMPAGKKLFDQEDSEQRDGFTSVALSPDGKTLAWVADGITLWNVENRKKEETFAWGKDPGPFNLPNGFFVAQGARLEFSPDGKALAVGLATGSVKVFDVPGGKEQFGYSHGGSGTLRALRFTRDGTEIMSAAVVVSLGSEVGGREPSKPIRRWDLRSGKEKNALRPALRIRCVAVSPDGQTLAAGTEEWVDARVSGRVILFDVVTGQQKASWSAHDGPVRALAFHPGGKTLASAGKGASKIAPFGFAQGKIKLWPVDPPGPAIVLDDQGAAMQQAMLGEVTALCFDAFGKQLAIAINRNILVRDLDTGKSRSLLETPLSTLSGPQQIVHAMAYSPDGRILAVGGQRQERKRGTGAQWVTVGGEVRLLDVRAGGEIITFQGHAGAVHWIAFAVDGRSLVSGAVSEEKGEPVEAREWDAGKIVDRLRAADR